MCFSCDASDSGFYAAADNEPEPQNKHSVIGSKPGFDQSTTKQKFERVLNIIKDLDYSDKISLFEIRQSLHQHKGGFSSVYRVQVGEMDLAVKLITLGYQYTNPVDNGYDREYRTKRDLKYACEEIKRWHILSNKHENILPFRGFVLDRLHMELGLVSDYMPNGSLQKLIVRQDLPSLDIELFPFIMGAAKGLKAIHSEGVVHGDIKSANILISNDGKALICDFGLSRLIEETSRYSINTSGTRGTVRWMSPEQFPPSSDQPVIPNIRNDIWSFGMLLYECLSKKRPYDIHEEHGVIFLISGYKLPIMPDHMTEFQIKLWGLCQLCWSRPELRPTMSDVINQLDSLRSELTV